MKGLSELDPVNPPELHRFEYTDPDILINVSEECVRDRCSLQEGHKGPHAEISPFNGMIYEVWGADGVQVSTPALQVAHAINDARDEAMQALDDAHFLRSRLRNKYKEVTKEVDPILRMLLDDFDWWPTTGHDLDSSGFSESSDEGLKNELMRMFEGDD